MQPCGEESFILIYYQGDKHCNCMKIFCIFFSGNQMGDIGARMLAKALMINTKLHTIHWDRNHTTSQGFQDIAAAIQK